MLPCLENLVRSFADDDGFPEATFEATAGLIAMMVNDEAEAVFRHYVDATNGRFYLCDEVVEACITDMRSAEEMQPRILTLTNILTLLPQK